MSTGGLSGERLGRMKAVLAGHVEQGKVPGLVAAVSRRGEVHVEVLGTKTAGGDDPVERDTVFRIASMTKPITAVATLILVEEGRLSLDEPVDGLLPEMADRRVLRRPDGPLDDTVPAQRPLTTRDLLIYVMGFGIVFAPPGTYPIQQATDELLLGQGAPNPSVPPAPDEWIRRLGTLPLLHQPGDRWMYHTGSDVLGVLIARIAGQPFETFLRERIFEPLGMKDTGFSVPQGQSHRLPTSYGINFDTGEPAIYDPPDGQWSRPPAFPSGGGGLVSTADDYLAFGRMLLNGGKLHGRRILSRPAVELMTSDQLTPAQKAASTFEPGYWDTHGWGFGVAIVTGRHDLWAPVGRYGWDGGLGTSWASDPSEDLVGVILTQQAFTSARLPAICRDFWACAYAAIDD